MRKIAVVTGIRCDYGILYPVLKEIANRSNLELQLIVAGAHLSHTYGYTIKEIEKDNFKISAKVDMLLSDDTGARMARSLGVGILEFTQVFEMLKPDVVIVIGDREEMFAAAVSALCLNVAVAHMHGGEVATGGHIDESIRHAITKFAHIHFAATQKSAQRIISLGEEPWRVHWVGATFADNVLLKKVATRDIIYKKYSLDSKKPLIMVLQHPLTLESKYSEEHMEEIMEGVASFKLPTIVIYPNADAGSSGITRVIDKYKKFDFIKTYKTVPSSDYLGLLQVAKVLVGNSSSAVVEAPFFHLPAINIGDRQQGREMAENVINTGYNRKAIKLAIKKALFDPVFQERVKNCKNPYGSGGAAKKIIDILSKIEVTKRLLQKKLYFKNL